MYRSGAPAEARLFTPLPPPPPSRSRALPFFVLGEVTPSWSSFTRNCFLLRSFTGFLLTDVVAMATAGEQAEEAEESRSPMEVTVVTSRPAPQFPPLPKVEWPLAILLNESTSKGEPKMPLIGVGGVRGWEAGRWNNPKSRSRILLLVLRDVPLKRKKSTGGFFLGTDQFNKEVLPLVTVSVTDVGVLTVLGTECIFFGLPTEIRASNRKEL